jgi:hypothetical protein
VRLFRQDLYRAARPVEEPTPRDPSCTHCELRYVHELWCPIRLEEWRKNLLTTPEQPGRVELMNNNNTSIQPGPLHPSTAKFRYMRDGDTARDLALDDAAGTVWVERTLVHTAPYDVRCYEALVAFLMGPTR